MSLYVENQEFTTIPQILSTTRLIAESLLSIFVLPYILEHPLKQNGRYQITPSGI